MAKTPKPDPQKKDADAAKPFDREDYKHPPAVTTRKGMTGSTT